MTDIMGNPLTVVVHAANIHGTVGGVMAYDEAAAKYPSIEAVSGDMGYRGTFRGYAVKSGRKCDITERIKPKAWAAAPKRRAVERTFGRASHSRRLSKDYKIFTSSETTWFIISHCRSVLRRY